MLHEDETMRLGHEKLGMCKEHGEQPFYFMRLQHKNQGAQWYSAVRWYACGCVEVGNEAGVDKIVHRFD